METTHVWRVFYFRGMQSFHDLRPGRQEAGSQVIASRLPQAPASPRSAEPAASRQCGSGAGIPGQPLPRSAARRARNHSRADNRKRLAAQEKPGRPRWLAAGSVPPRTSGRRPPMASGSVPPDRARETHHRRPTEPCQGDARRRGHQVYSAAAAAEAGAAGEADTRRRPPR